MIYARRSPVGPDQRGRTAAIDHQFESEDAFDAWLDHAPDAVAATLVISDDKPLPTLAGSQGGEAYVAAPRMPGSVPDCPHAPTR
jgi:hypothetical protein